MQQPLSRIEIKSAIFKMGKQLKDICQEIGIDPSSMSAYLSGSRTMSKNAQLMFTHFIKLKELENQHGKSH